MVFLFLFFQNEMLFSSNSKAYWEMGKNKQNTRESYKKKCNNFPGISTINLLAYSSDFSSKMRIF